jgi:hypothetical protein
LCLLKHALHTGSNWGINQYRRCKEGLGLVEQVIPLPKASKSNFEVSHSIMSYNNPINQCHIIGILHPTVRRQKLNFVFNNQISISFRLRSDWHLSHTTYKVSVFDKVPETKLSRVCRQLRLYTLIQCVYFK